MGRSSYSGGKRAREADKARKKKEKAAKRKRRREEGPQDVPIALASEVQEVEDVPEHDESDTAARTGPPCRLFVGGLAWETDEPGLREAFEEAGEVVDVKLILDRDGRSRGFGFVTMADRKAGKAAISGLDGSELDGRSLKVSLATEKRH